MTPSNRYAKTGMILATTLALAILPMRAVAMRLTDPATAKKPAATAEQIHSLAAKLHRAQADYAAFKARTDSAALPGKPLLDRSVIAGQTKLIAASATRRQAKALQQTDPNLTIRFSPSSGAATCIEGPALMTARTAANRRGLSSAKVSSSAIAFSALAEFAGLLRVTDPENEFTATATLTDDDGTQHLRLAQTYQGLPIWGRDIVVHLTADNTVFMINGRTLPTPTLSTTPVITAEQATAIAEAAFDRVLLSESPQLLVHVGKFAFARLAWRVAVQPDALHRWQLFIDARTGVIVERYNDTRNAGSSAAGSGTNLDGISVNFNCWKHTDNTYYMFDATQAMNTAKPNLPNSMGQGTIAVLNLNYQEPETNSQVFTVSSNSATSGWDATAVTMMDYLRRTYAYYATTFSRNSLDDRGMNIVGVIHVSHNYANAFWDPGVQMAFFGDGDGSEFGSLSNSLDIVAHELTHGVTGYTANLEYKFQSGALNEATSDFFACMVDRDDWTAAEDVVLIPPYFMRSLADPHQGLDRLPANMNEYENLPISDDNGGVHVNMTIPARAGYLIAEGLTDAGLGTSVGRAHAEQIWYKALTQYLTSTSDFVDFRRAMLQAAEDLYGADSADTAATALAFDTVGIIDTGTGGGTGGGQVDPIEGDDLMVFIYYTGGKPYIGMQAENGQLYSVSNTATLAEAGRPAVTDDGTLVVFVDETNNLHIASLNPSDTYDEQATTVGIVRTISASKDGTYLAYTTTDYDNTIRLLDMTDDSGNSDRTLTLAWSTDADVASGSVNYAEVIDFDLSNTHLYFDAESRLTLSGAGEPLTYWCIGVVDLASDLMYTLVPSLPAGVSIGNPITANTLDYLIAFDIVEDATSNCETVVGDMITGDLGTVYSETPSNFYGWPAFNGDDTAIAMNYNDNIAVVPLVEDSGILVGDADSAYYAIDLAYYPRYYRVGSRTIQPQISVTPTSLAFGSVSTESYADRTVVVSNTGTGDLHLANWTLSDTANYLHNGASRTLAPGQQVSFTVRFAPVQTGARNGTLKITSNDADTPTVTVNLSGTGTSPNGDDDDDDDTGGGLFNCFVATASYNTYLADDVQRLRNFRDGQLAQTPAGRAFVQLYYACSPPIANVIGNDEPLRRLSRTALTPIVYTLKALDASGWLSNDK